MECSEPIFIPMGDHLTYHEIEKRIYVYNKIAYINDSDFNNNEFKSVRRRLKLR